VLITYAPLSLLPTGGLFIFTQMVKSTEVFASTQEVHKEKQNLKILVVNKEILICIENVDTNQRVTHIIDALSFMHLSIDIKEILISEGMIEG
jgi:hypothetical protein